MAGQKTSAIKQLLASVPEGFLVDSKWLAARGVSRQLLQQYVKSGWFERVGHGLVRKPSVLMGEEEAQEWILPVLSAQWMGYDVHVGGPTALELQGHGHYLRLGGRPVVYLYSDSPPSWVKKLEVNAELRFRKLNLFGDAERGVSAVDGNRFGGGSPVVPWTFQLAVSLPERAILEALDELPLNEGFDGLDGVFASLSGLRPNLLASLLGACRSVKVKRLFFVFADRHAHAWRKYLDVSDFDLGSGDRQFVVGGRLHPDYRITVPADFMPTRLGVADGA